jgi:hypothetical protein
MSLSKIARCAHILIVVLCAFLPTGASEAPAAEPANPEPSPGQPDRNLEGKEGYIWLGNLNPDSTISDSNIAESGTKVHSYSTISTKKKFTLTANLYLRDGEPPNDSRYFKALPILGVLLSGVEIEILDAPVVKTRPSGLNQIWCRVKVSKTRS